MNKSYFNPVNSSFWLFTLAIFCALILPQLVQDGMFVDGIFYAAISHNLAHHLGTFWNPHYSETLYPSLHEQPPLMFWMQAQFFRLLGDSIYVERIYSLLTAIMNAVGISLIWKEIFKDNSKLIQQGWLPILLWIIVPICFWTYVNNMEECTMSIFDVFAVYFIFKSFNQSNKIPFLLIAGGFIFLASLTKGPQGLFPLCVVALRYFTHKNISLKLGCIYSLVILSVPTIIYLYFFSNPVIRESFHQYFQRRFVLTFNNQNQTTDFRFYLIFRLLGEMIPVLLFTSIVIIFNRKKKIIGNYFQENKKNIIFFMLIGLSASLPLMITKEQRGFYLVTSLPYFSLAFAIIISPYISLLINQFMPKLIRIFKIISIILFAGVMTFTFMQFGKTKRDEVLLHDIYEMQNNLTRNTIVSTNHAIFYDWFVHAYFQRLLNVSLDEDSLRTYVLIYKTDSVKPNTKGYFKVSLPTIRYDLYQMRKNESSHL